MTRKKTLILIRHAHRDTSDREADNGLSAKGRAQAAALLKHFIRTFGDGPKPVVLSSPKRRCVETVQPIAREAGEEVKVSRLLVEQGGRESQDDLLLRAEKFLDWWREKGPSLTIACSHGDWLPFAVEAATGGRVEFRKGAWAEITLGKGGEAVLSALIQEFRPVKGTSIAQKG